MKRMHETFISFYLAGGRVHIKADAVRGIGEPPFVRFLIAEDGKSMVMEPYNRKVFASMRVPPTMYKKTGQRARMEIKCAPVCRYLAACLGWDESSTYRVPGRILPQQRFVLFDLTSAYSIHGTAEEVQ